MVKIKVKALISLQAKSRGLLGYEKASPILIKTRFGIHTFGMKFPIDVIILNAKGEIVKMTEHLKPNKIFAWPPAYDTVIELPAGEINKKRLITGERVELQID